jgi:hypothetical protein
MKSATSTLRLDLSDTFFPKDRWAWEETGWIHVLPGLGVYRDKARKVALEIRLLIKELSLPIRVVSDCVSKRRTDLLRCINEVKRGKHLDETQILDRINQSRRVLPRLRSGLVILLDPDRIEPFGKTDEKERGIYGSSHADGVCLLRAWHGEAVRHELAHMLGLGEHCANPDCVMDWGCPSQTFCRSCLRKIKRICCVQHD